MSKYVVIMTAVDGTVSAAGPFDRIDEADHFADEVTAVSDLETAPKLLEPPRRVLGGLRWRDRAMGSAQ